MPPKKVTCEICNKTVMKAQTLAYKTGRACREHEGVQEYSEQLQIQKKHDLNKSIENHGKKYTPKSEAVYEAVEKRMNVCWKCGCQGTDLGTFYIQKAVAIEKMELLSACNIEDMQTKIQEFIPKEFQTPLIFISMGDKKKNILDRFRFKKQLLVECSDFIQVCPECLKLIGLEKKYQDEVKERIKGIKLDQMFMLGSLLKPELQKIAINQLYEDGVIKNE